MKKIKLTGIASILFLLLAFTSSAQIKKGTVTGGINFSGSNVNKFDSSGKITENFHWLNISPFLSYALKNNFTIGTYATLGNSENSLFNFSKNNHNFSTALFARKYIPISQKFYSYLQTDIKYSSFAGVINYGDNYRSKNISMNLSGGFGYKISPRLGVELGLNNLAGINLFHQSLNVTNGQIYKSLRPRFNAGNVFQSNGLHLGLTIKF